MSNWLHSFVLTFIPLFIVIDSFGTLPFVLSLSAEMTPWERNKMVSIATATATGVGLVFLFLGQFILSVMGISIGSFSVAGGILLLILSIRHMITGQMVDVVKEEMVAIVPVGTPLTVGPATIVTLLLLAGQFPLYMVVLAFVLNMAIVFAVFLLGDRLAAFLGRGGLKAVSSVFSLLLAAIAVNMVIQGLDSIGVIDVNLSR